METLAVIVVSSTGANAHSSAIQQHLQRLRRRRRHL